MEAIKHLIKVPINRELKIQLPATTVADSEAEVIVLFRSQAKATKEAKYALMREAVKDELFLADLKEVMDDFKHADFEEISSLDEMEISTAVQHEAALILPVLVTPLESPSASREKDRCAGRRYEFKL